MHTAIQDLENILTEQGKKISELKNRLLETENEWNTRYKTLLLDFLQVIDTFDQAEMIIEEKCWNENEIANKAINRLLTAKKKALTIFKKHGVTPMAFENNMANDDDCKVIDTEYDRDYPSNYILRTEKKGYNWQSAHEGQLRSENLRSAEVVIVKN